ncbi:phospholipase A2 inhibitor gamma subunit B-like [Ambystoma mexicanum]|uniref:phospholipase A2 inhibitor gamma subunit B-like n=1 Tax=Ambystoma mexicanum TaxID=8296 RepID=UPI0037E92404
MRTALPIACILTALLAEGYARQCLTCAGLSPAMCIGTVQTCATRDDVCMASYTTRIISNLPVREFTRMCGQAIFCKIDQTMTAPSMTIRKSTTCCTSDTCTPPEPKEPVAPDTKENGVTCHACSAQDYYCDTKEKMKCTGSETRCSRYALKTEQGSKVSQIALRGCASENFCAVGSSSKGIGGTSITIDMACTDAGIRPEYGLLLPLFAALAMLKLFY